VLFCSIVQVKDKLAVVTGGARRVGRAIVEALAAAGARPVIHYHRSEAEARELATRLGGIAIRADLGEAEGVRELCAAVLALEGELALLVNSASRLERRRFEESDDALWQRSLELTLLAPARCARALAPRMREARGGALIVNVLDLAAEHPWPGHAHHCVAKAGLQMLTRCLALELAPEIRVCGVTPGLVAPSADPSWARLLERVPLGRAGTPEEVGQAVLHLCQADYLTGSTIIVDGGLGLR
jgi:pteridine reductase